MSTKESNAQLHTKRITENTNRILNIIQKSAIFAKVKIKHNSQATPKIFTSKETKAIIKKMMIMDKKGQGQSEDYKKKQEELNNSIGIDYFNSHIKIWKKLEQLDIKKDQELFWKTQNEYWKKQKATQQKIEGQMTDIIIQEDGTTITEKKEILNKALEIQQKITELEDLEAIEYMKDNNIKKSKIKQKQLKLSKKTEQIKKLKKEKQLKMKITIKETKKALNTLKNKKAPGYDHLPNELLKHMNEEMIKIITTYLMISMNTALCQLTSKK